MLMEQHLRHHAQNAEKPFFC